jgi:hypothetical protein
VRLRAFIRGAEIDIVSFSTTFEARKIQFQGGKGLVCGLHHSKAIGGRHENQNECESWRPVPGGPPTASLHYPLNINVRENSFEGEDQR